MGIKGGAGNLRHFIKVERLCSENKDGIGGVVTKWQQIDEVPASVEPLSGNELFNARQVDSQVTHRIRIRYYEGLRNEDRFDVNSRKLNIKFIKNVAERNFEHEVLCQETVTHGG